MGLVARRAGRTQVMLAYFFPEQRQEIPPVEEIGKFTKENAIAIWMCSGLYIKLGKWPLIGRFPNWKKEDWPMIDFIRREEYRSPPRAWLVRYEDDNPLKLLFEIPHPIEDKLLPTDCSSGSGAAEIKLSHLLEWTAPIPQPKP